MPLHFSFLLFFDLVFCRQASQLRRGPRTGSPVLDFWHLFFSFLLTSRMYYFYHTRLLLGGAPVLDDVELHMRACVRLEIVERCDGGTRKLKMPGETAFQVGDDVFCGWCAFALGEPAKF
ncbi:hypothetical protein QBC43DRAFT_336295 [Cladorrhinum sp. PSN259]|nr:hypothetical protein QBC43DRAFT_336295 [Cladorrhinum sp. PSN259]